MIEMSAVDSEMRRRNDIILLFVYTLSHQLIQLTWTHNKQRMEFDFKTPQRRELQPKRTIYNDQNEQTTANYLPQIIPNHFQSNDRFRFSSPVY